MRDAVGCVCPPPLIPRPPRSRVLPTLTPSAECFCVHVCVHMCARVCCPCADVRILSEESTLSLTYFGNITQSTGEDWNDCKLVRRCQTGAGSGEWQPPFRGRVYDWLHAFLLLVVHGPTRTVTFCVVVCSFPSSCVLSFPSSCVLSFPSSCVLSFPSSCVYSWVFRVLVGTAVSFPTASCPRPPPPGQVLSTADPAVGGVPPPLTPKVASLGHAPRRAPTYHGRGGAPGGSLQRVQEAVAMRAEMLTQNAMMFDAPAASVAMSSLGSRFGGGGGGARWEDGARARVCGLVGRAWGRLRELRARGRLCAPRVAR